MPGIEIAVSSPASSDHSDRLVFRSHKSLPRRTNSNSDGQPAQIPLTDHDDHFSDGRLLATAPILPLTPPGVTQDDSPTDIDMQKPTSSHSVAALTPSKPSHPPTPETTPPRGMASSRPGLGHFGYISSSSRAESFKTAYEAISDAETVTPRPSPPPLSRSNTQKSTKSSREIAGVDGSDMRKKSITTNEGLSSRVKGSPRRKVSGSLPSQGHENQSRNSKACRQDVSNGHISEQRIKPVQKKSDRSRKATDTNMPDVDVSVREMRNLRDRVTHMQQSEDNSAMDRFRQEIGWPSVENQCTPSGQDDTRRLSGVSTSSTVEAMIIDTPKPAKRALRHTEKRLSLRSASSPITKSERTSTASSLDLQRRLSHKTARITENDRKSIASEVSVSGSSTLGALQQCVDVVPVVVIPQRRSSLMGPSTPSSRNTSLSRSRPSSRAPTVRKSRPEPLDIPRQKRRTVSDSQAQNIPVDLRGRSLNRPVIPLRSSSLSAPTSQNNSRATSLTSESLRSHNRALDHTAVERLPKPEPVLPVAVLDAPKQAKHDAAEASKTQSILIGVEDLHYLRPPSVPFTPHSIPSSSPGPFEINEVRRVAIFPHNNESLLLVNPHGQSGLREQLPQLDLPRTPDIMQQPTTDVDSPLRNPRPPPQPPISNGNVKSSIAGLEQPAAQLNSERGSIIGTSRPSKDKRRPWMVRPRSESFNSFVRTLSLSSAKNPKAGEDIDGRLQPFWRPRRFWDDSPDSLSPDEEGSQYRTIKQSDEVISNSIGMPQKRIIFDGPSLSASRAGTKRRADGYHRTNRDALVGRRIITPEALYSQTSLHQRQFPSTLISRWRLRFRSGMARSFRWRVRRSIQQRAEGKREVRREKLKQSIGEAVLMDSSTQVRKAIQ